MGRVKRKFNNRCSYLHKKQGSAPLSSNENRLDSGNTAMGKSATYLIAALGLTVLLTVQCAEKNTDISAEDHRIVSALVEAIRINRDLHDSPDSLEKARQGLLENHQLTEETLRRWLDDNQDNLALWQEVARRVQQGIEEEKKIGVSPDEQ